MPDLSPEARARAERTIEVAAIFAANADAIIEAMAYVPEGFVLVALVDGNHSFSGLHQISTAAMVEEVPALEADGGWAMVFPYGTSRDDVDRRTADLADINRQRIAAIDRINARRV